MTSIWPYFLSRPAFASGRRSTIPGVGTSEISLILSGAAAAGSIAAVAITYRLGVRRFDHERELSDLDAVRLVLDDVATAMQVAHSKMAMIYKHLGNYAEGAEGTTFPLVREHRFQLETAHIDLAAQQGRLEIRFGFEHELADICRTVGGAVLSAVYDADQIEKTPVVNKSERSETINGAIVEVGLGREAFTLTAYRTVGVRLPAKQRTDV